MKKQPHTTVRRFPDQILTDDQGMVRVTLLHSDDVITVKGHKITVSDIPVSRYSLRCGHTGHGIALSANDVVFCPECETNEYVVTARG